MLSWLQKHNKKINFFGGIFILLLTVVFYFWTTRFGSIVSQTEQSSVKKPFERSYSSPNIIKRTSKKEKDMSVFSEKLKESTQAENFLLFLMLLGFSMVIYSLYSKYKQKKIL